DPELESVLVRFRQLKRDLMQIIAERDQLETDTKKSNDHNETVLAALAAVVTDDASRKSHAGGKRPVNVSDLFARFLDGEMEALRRRTYATPSERDALRANLDRYRRYNETLRAAGLGQDQKARIEALSKAVEALPVQGGVLTAFSAAGPATLVLIAALVLATGALGWVAAERGRRLASLQSSGGRGGAGGPPPRQAQVSFEPSRRHRGGADGGPAAQPGALRARGPGIERRAVGLGSRRQHDLLLPALEAGARPRRSRRHR